MTDTPTHVQAILSASSSSKQTSDPSSALASSAYCFISANNVHCIPVNEFNTITDALLPSDELSGIQDDASYTPDKLYLRNRNLLFRLNNLSIYDSDLEHSSVANLPGSSPLQLASQGASYRRLSPLRKSLTPSPVPSRSPSPTLEESQVSEIISNYNTHAIYLPKLVINSGKDMELNYPELRKLLSRVLPHWSTPSEIEFEKLTGGITNVLLQAKHEGASVLIRAYGHGTNLIIDRHREFISHLLLHSIGLAPPIYCRFKNGLVYGFLPGRSLQPSELSNPSIYPLIAQQLGKLHELLDYTLIERGVVTLSDFLFDLSKRSHPNRHRPKKCFISNIWDLIEDWIDIVPANSNLISSFATNLPEQNVDEKNLRDVINGEFKWLRNHLEKAKSRTVAAHSDLLSGNIIVPDSIGNSKLQSLPDRKDNPIKFIDYEYMMPAPRAFDIANHLAEWQGFLCDRSKIPEPRIDNPVLVEWAKGYLNNKDASVEQVSQLIAEIATFYGLPGFYWGIWAMIQSELSTIEFNYAEYGENRLLEYWDWKRVHFPSVNSQ